jgi:hypothetical protein
VAEPGSAIFLAKQETWYNAMRLHMNLYFLLKGTAFCPFRGFNATQARSWGYPRRLPPTRGSTILGMYEEMKTIPFTNKGRRSFVDPIKHTSGALGIAVRRVRQVIAVPAFTMSPADTICARGSIPVGVVPAYLSKPDFSQCLTGAKACDALSAMRLVGTSGPNLVPLSDSARRNGIERTPASILHSLGGQR